MKSAKEIMEYYKPARVGDYIKFDTFIEIVEQTQMEAYNECVNDALDKYLLTPNRNDIEQSILSLIKK